MKRIRLTEKNLQALTIIRDEQDKTDGSWVTAARFVELKAGSPPTSEMQVQSAVGYLSRLVTLGYLREEVVDKIGKRYKITRKGRTLTFMEV